MEKKLKFDELPSVFGRPFVDGTVCYYVVHHDQDIFFTKEFGELRSFLQGYFVALGYPYVSLEKAHTLIKYYGL